MYNEKIYQNMIDILKQKNIALQTDNNVKTIVLDEIRQILSVEDFTDEFKIKVLKKLLGGNLL